MWKKSTWILTWSTNDNFLCFFDFLDPNKLRISLKKSTVTNRSIWHCSSLLDSYTNKTTTIIFFSYRFSYQTISLFYWIKELFRTKKSFLTKETSQSCLLLFSLSLSVSIDDECILSAQMIQFRYTNISISSSSQETSFKIFAEKIPQVFIDHSLALDRIWRFDILEERRRVMLSFFHLISVQKNHSQIDWRKTNQILSDGSEEKKKKSCKSFCKCLFSFPLFSLMFIHQWNSHLSFFFLFKQLNETKTIKAQEIARALNRWKAFETSKTIFTSNHSSISF